MSSCQTKLTSPEAKGQGRDLRENWSRDLGGTLLTGSLSGSFTYTVQAHLPRDSTTNGKSAPTSVVNEDRPTKSR